MSRRKQRRKQEKAQRHAPSSPDVRRRTTPRQPAVVPGARTAEPREVVREARYVERLAYTRSQAAEALGISRSSFDRHVLPFVETVELGSGTRLIPVDEVERYAAARRRPARRGREGQARLGRPAALPMDVAERIQREREDGSTLAQIARGLNAAGVPTAHGGARWWPSTVRAVIDRVSR